MRFFSKNKKIKKSTINNLRCKLFIVDYLKTTVMTTTTVILRLKTKND